MPFFSARVQLHLKHGFELMRWMTVITLSLVLPLVLGQLLRLRSVIWPINPDMSEALINLFLGGSLILLEAAFPISILIVSILCVRRWRTEGIYFDWCCMGGSPLQLVTPLLSLGLITSISSYYIANQLSPRTIAQLSTQAEDLVQKRWRALIPRALEEAHLPISNSEGITIPHRSSWLFESHLTEGDVFSYIGCDHQEHTCLSTWWCAEDESAQGVELRDLMIKTPTTQIQMKTFTLSLPPLQLDRVHKTFGPPNSLQNHELNFDLTHHRFIFHKRQSMAWLCLIFAIIGACSALLLNLSQCLFVSGVLLSVGFGLLRSLELIARAGWLSPIIAAWMPDFILVAIASWFVLKLQRSPPKPL
jgi:lipopolysaccharide export LptBFGC system permease protein LptF